MDVKREWGVNRKNAIAHCKGAAALAWVYGPGKSWTCSEFNGNKIKKFYVFLYRNQSVLAKSKKYTDWKDYIKLTAEIDALSYLEWCAKVKIWARCHPLNRKCTKAK